METIESMYEMFKFTTKAKQIKTINSLLISCEATGIKMEKLKNNSPAQIQKKTLEQMKVFLLRKKMFFSVFIFKIFMAQNKKNLSLP